MRRTKKLVASLFATGLLAVGVGAPTAAAQPVQQDGLVNVVIYDVTIQDVVDVVVEDVNVGVAAQVAANICGVKVGPVAVLGTAVDRSGDFRTVCETGTQQVRLIQN
jgi:hypothetical protein